MSPLWMFWWEGKQVWEAGERPGRGVVYSRLLIHGCCLGSGEGVWHIWRLRPFYTYLGRISLPPCKYKQWASLTRHLCMWRPCGPPRVAAGGVCYLSQCSSIPVPRVHSCGSGRRKIDWGNILSTYMIYIILIHICIYVLISIISPVWFAPNQTHALSNTLCSFLYISNNV